MRTFRVFVSAITIVFAFVINSYGQLAFDVKTLMQEKSQLKFIKIAVINNLQNSNWAKVTEFGENYSFWLTNLKRTQLGDSVQSEFDFDLRTPAMLTHGKHIISKHISVIFDTTICSNIANSSDTLLTNMIVDGLKSTDVYADILQLVSSAIPMGRIFVQMFADKFILEFKRTPTPLEQLEANLLGAKAVVELHNTLVSLNIIR